MSAYINESAAIGAVVGIVLGWGVMRLLSGGRMARLSNIVTGLERDLAVERERIEHKDAQVESLQRKERELTDAVTELERRLAAERERTLHKESQIDLLKQTEKNMADAFENLANRIMESNSSKFTEQNKVNIGEVLNPLREQLGDFKKKVEDVYERETRDRRSLHHEIVNLKSLNEQMSQDAINLTNALKGESKTRGDWGEVILERVLEVSGLVKGREYELQAGYSDGSGRLRYPDAVVHLPDKKDVVIDSKVSLLAYERYCSSEGPQQEKALEEHLESIRNHVRGLESKEYDKLDGINSLDLVLMFVPIEPALMLAFQQDEHLFRNAFGKGIFLVSPSTLSLNLQIIHNLWRYEYQNQNSREIARRAGEMYDKFVGFVEAFEDIGNKLDKAQEAYDTACKRLRDGKGNLIGRAKAIRELGLETKKTLPGNPVESVGKE